VNLIGQAVEEVRALMKADPTPRTASELSEKVGRSLNTIGSALAVLMYLGEVTSSFQPRLVKKRGATPKVYFPKS
jgi:hypothetical protein